MTTPPTGHTNGTNGTGHNVSVRRDQPPSPLGWHPRQASPRKRAARIAASIEACIAEGQDWSYSDYGIGGDADMIALVESHLDLEFYMTTDGLDTEEPAPMPNPQTRNGTHHAAPARVHAEATVSANCHLMLEGHDVQVTIRSGATPHEVEVVVGTMAGMLRAYAHQPPAAAAESPPPPAAQQAAAESPPPPAAQPPGEHEVETPYCFEHGQTYRRNEKHGEVWYSHKISNPVSGGPKWCRY